MLRHMQNSPANSASTSSTEYPLPDFRNSIFSSIPYPVVLASYYQYSSTYLFIFPSKLPQTSCALPLAVIYCQHNTAAKRVESMNNQAYCQIAPEKISHPPEYRTRRKFGGCALAGGNGLSAASIFHLLRFAIFLYSPP
jgi:hypothetical protein